MYYYILNTKVPSRYLLDDISYDDYFNEYDDISTLSDLQLDKLIRDNNKEKEE